MIAFQGAAKNILNKKLNLKSACKAEFSLNRVNFAIKLCQLLQMMEYVSSHFSYLK